MTTENTGGEDERGCNDTCERQLAELQRRVNRLTDELAAARKQIAELYELRERIRTAVIACRRQSAGGWPQRRRALHELEERLSSILEILPGEIRPAPDEPPSLLERTTKLWRKAAAKAALWKHRNKTPPHGPESLP